MRVQILGSGGYFPSERRHTACYFLPECEAVFDAGTGAFRLLDRLTSPRLDVFLSHAHLDHIVGLTYLLLPMVQGRLKTIRLFGTPKTLDAVRTHLFSDPVFPVMPEFEFRPLPESDDAPQADGIELADGGILTHQSLPSHPGGTTGYRIDWPTSEGQGAKSFAYITDTTVDGTYTEFIRGVDVLVHECYFANAEAEWAIKTGHSHLTPVLEVAREADVGRLLLVHVDPERTDVDPLGLNEARSLFSPVEYANDQQTIDIDE